MKTKSFQPPSMKEFIQYIADNKLSIKNPESLWQGYNDGDWFDTRGNPVRNWKLKLRTLSNMAEFLSEKPKQDLSIGKCCYRCGSGIRKSNGRAGVIWEERLPWCSLRCYKLWVKEKKPKY